MKIEVGKTYRTRSGELVAIHREGDGDGEFDAFLGFLPGVGREQGWAADGRYHGVCESYADLIEEVTLQPDAPGIYDEAISARARMLADPAAPMRPQTTSGIALELDAAQQRQRGEQRMLDAERGIRSLRRSAVYQAVATCLIAIAVIIFGMRTANARDLLWMSNDAGGEIVLTDDVDGCGTARVVFARAAGGRTLMGCWAYTESGYVVARFGSDIRTWRLDDFKPFQAVPARGTRL